ncbi:MAG: Gfo/Idh/MocA family oxidoreductase [Rubripirellula sp.]|nr:Gfo/Idh/MocA family oxidoreductase [Rubripirellula sp.]
MMAQESDRPLRMGLIGGGGTGFIGKVHVTAATLDRQAELVAGAVSSNPDRARKAAVAMGIAPERAYRSFRELIDSEMARPVDDRIDFVSIATPNHTHREIACAALEAGFHVVCDKPMTISVSDAEAMIAAVNESRSVFALTHNYSGYPLVRQARELIAMNELGDLLAVRANYAQGWMHGMDPHETPTRGAWKSDPNRNGRAGSLGDVGTHAFHLVQFITGLTPSRLLSYMNSYSPHHELDDYGHAMLQFDRGATGMVTWSQVSHGRLNDLSIEVDGTKASLAWRQEQPNQLVVRALGQPIKIYERNPNAAYSLPSTVAACRLPGGHPEAFFEAFANVYRDAFTDMRRAIRGETIDSASALYPGVAAGADGVRFMQLCLASTNADAAWQSW